MSTATANVIVYTGNHCPYCTQLKKYLNEENIAFEERNVENNDQYAEELQSMGMSSIPVTVIGEHRILGNNPTKLKKALATL
ncbi:glutaredoxin family protein [Paenibacillus agricola]|uniref:Glutaredoxin family protein n=1 Tax=Paenibacillus agricola TaxID=2716264 RepID=A0ABX0JCW4_9BACL|nr:glutaredoxin family protein [Paenibacillus agricola]NHN32064.1 glutaredoxin family protein [Paenibacillus agricola]